MSAGELVDRGKGGGVSLRESELLHKRPFGVFETLIDVTESSFTSENAMYVQDSTCSEIKLNLLLPSRRTRSCSLISR